MKLPYQGVDEVVRVDTILVCGKYITPKKKNAAFRKNVDRQQNIPKYAPRLIAKMGTLVPNWSRYGRPAFEKPPVCVSH